ncbi:MAG: sulfatase [Thermoanaerobaculales bacterium]
MAAILAAVAASSHAQAPASSARPNILVILVDDLGYGDLGSYGHQAIRSPNLDRLAADGVRFTDFYSAAPVCSPARAAFLTGRIPVRTGVYDWIPPGSDMHLGADETTVAELLRDAGYQTSMFGKWHLNGALDAEQPQPDDHGFDHWFATAGFAVPSHHNPVNFVRNGEEVGPVEGYACQIVTDEAIRWLREDRRSPNPFFAFVAYHEPHEVIASPPELAASYPATQNANEALYFANVTNLDLAIGRLLAALDELGLAKDTFVLFTSDNGPEMLERHPQAQRSYGSAGGLRGKKLQLWEGGIRVPGIVRWPGRVPPGTVSSVPVSGVDLLPTLCAVAGVTVPPELELDGVDAAPAFLGGEVDRRVPLFWYHYKAWGGPRAVLREGAWKLVGFWNGPERLRSDSSTMRPGDLELIRTTELVRFELFDLESDLGERHDVAAKNPAVFASMRAEMVRLLAEVQADARRDWRESWLRRW